jgi:hypothetical protein
VKIEFYSLPSNNSRRHRSPDRSKDKQRGSERIVFKLESEKSKLMKSHWIAAAIFRGKTVAEGRNREELMARDGENHDGKPFEFQSVSFIFSLF